MKKVILSMIMASVVGFGETIIVPVESDINLCQQSISKPKEKLATSIDAKFLTEWFKKAFNSSIDRETISYLKSPPTLYEVERALASMETMYKDGSCKNFADNLNFSYTKALESIDRASKNNLGTQVKMTTTDKYRVSASSTDVYKSALGTLERIDTLPNGAELRLTDQYSSNLYVKWGEFVFAKSEDGNKTIGWIKMDNVSMDNQR